MHGEGQLYGLGQSLTKPPYCARSVPGGGWMRETTEMTAPPRVLPPSPPGARVDTDCPPGAPLPEGHCVGAHATFSRPTTTPWSLRGRAQTGARRRE